MVLKIIAFKDEENLTEDDNITLTNLYEKMTQEYGWSEDKPFYKMASQNCRFEIFCFIKVLTLYETS